MDQREIFSIRQMIGLTGLSEYTIRGWESRYSIFNPLRSKTGRREYSKSDIEKALLLRELIKRGYKISTLSMLNNLKLLALFEQAGDRFQNKNNICKSKVVSTVFELMALQKWTKLSDFFKKIQFKNTRDLINFFFLPLLAEFTIGIRSGVISLAQEHVFTSLLKEKIYSSLRDLELQKKNKNLNAVSLQNKIRFILATPEGDFHEVGLLLAHLLIRSLGLTSLFLGPHTPSQDLSETALRFEASHLLIVSTISKKQGARQNILNFVSDVQKKLGLTQKILIAGVQAPPANLNQQMIASSSVLSFSNFSDFEIFLHSLKNRKSM